VSIFTSHFIFFGVTDTQYERNFRSLISNSIREALKLDSNRFEQPVVKDQTFLIKDSLIVMSDKLVYSPGEKISIHSLSEVEGEVFLFEVGTSEKKLLDTFTIPPNKNFSWVTVNSLSGFDLTVFSEFEFSPPAGYAGWLQARVLAGEEERNIPIYIDSDWATKTPNSGSEALFIESTNTLKAYNSANSLRNNYSNPYNLSGKFSRPNVYPMNYLLTSPTINIESENSLPNSISEEIDSISCNDHLANANFALKYSLEQTGLRFDLASDESLETSPIPQNYKLIIFSAHAEYWSTGMFENVQKFVERGGSVLFLGGNNAWRFVESTDDSFEIFWGNGAQTPEQISFVEEILGTYWDMRGYNTFAPFVTKPAITNFTKDIESEKQFGTEIIIPRCRTQVSGISGHETDKLLSTAHNQFQILATGTNPWFGGADIVTRETEFGGHLLNFSSTGIWMGINDPIYKEIIGAYLNNVLG
jgi:hypothetical protein